MKLINSVKNNMITPFKVKIHYLHTPVMKWKKLSTQYLSFIHLVYYSTEDVTKCDENNSFMSNLF